MKQSAPKEKSARPDAVPSAKSRSNSMEVVINGLLQLRREALAIGLPKVTTCLDYAYYEALGALRESQNKSKDDSQALP